MRTCLVSGGTILQHSVVKIFSVRARVSATMACGAQTVPVHRDMQESGRSDTSSCASLPYGMTHCWLVFIGTRWPISILCLFFGKVWEWGRWVRVEPVSKRGHLFGSSQPVPLLVSARIIGPNLWYKCKSLTIWLNNIEITQDQMWN